MKRYVVTMMVPQTRTIEAPDIQGAHNEVHRMLNNGTPADFNVPHPIVHSIVEENDEAIRFGPSPAAA
jgi:hypothetical protein